VACIHVTNPDMSARAARTYSSPLRAEQAEQTTARIVQAAVDLLSEGDASDLSMAEVAERAGVSVRTVYRSFAGKDELLDGVIGWINEHIGQLATSRPETRQDFETTTAAVVEVIFQIEPLYRALFATAAGRASHQRTARAREESMRAAYAAELEGLDDDEARRLLAVLHLVASSSGALFMKDYWDLPPEDIGRVIEWAIRVLADAASDPAQREGL
jgi:AcrR family transcriptional regulator